MIERFQGAFGAGVSEEVEETVWLGGRESLVRFGPHFHRVPLPDFLSAPLEDRYS